MAGQKFHELLIGATLGGNFNKTRLNYAGFRMQLKANDQRFATTPVAARPRRVDTAV
jgi:hypothetical protein